MEPLLKIVRNDARRGVRRPLDPAYVEACKLALGLEDDESVLVFPFGDDIRTCRTHARYQNIALQEWLVKHWPEMRPHEDGSEVLFISYSKIDDAYYSCVRFYPRGRARRVIHRNRRGE